MNKYIAKIYRYFGNKLKVAKLPIESDDTIHAWELANDIANNNVGGLTFEKTDKIPDNVGKNNILIEQTG